MIVRVYEASALEALLPHRYPFLLVDRAEVTERGRAVVGYKRISSTEWWLEGSAGCAMPFSLVLEALAQTSGVLLPDLLDGAEGGVAYFLGADRVRMRREPRVGDELRMHVTLAQWRRGICRTRGIATVGGHVAMTATLTTVVRGTARDE
jgi:3-hydroxyacyl-[acyl-carrier-protein] dehydratase